MARRSERQASFSVVRSLYSCAAEMPWAEIEYIVGKAFSDDEKVEIFECSEDYCCEKSRLDDAAPISDVLNLRKELSSIAARLVDVTERYGARLDGGMFDDGHVTPENKRVFKALSWIYGETDHNVREELRAAAQHCQRLLVALAEEPTEKSLKTDMVSPAVDSLTVFMKSVLEGATARPARGGHPGFIKKEANEYERWGIAIGPNVANFPAFVSAVLQTDVTKNQIAYAIDGASAPSSER